MIRTQIQLTDEQWRILKQIASERRLSLAELVRHGVDALLQQQGGLSREQRWERAAALVGRFSSGRNDLSSNHDELLAEDFAK
ncbi:MAG: CopG family transcriptional regulator [Deltaproteobacteria bacterium]|nr:MAG: CopG family transcriptional regulator [Deltaproteobacteria bacterium]